MNFRFSESTVIDILWWWENKDEDINKVICAKSPYSPMCDNPELLNKLILIANERGVDYKLLLGIMYAESHIWAAFKPQKCWVSNNRAGVKARKYNDGSVSVQFREQYKTLPAELQEQLNGCWLYYFESPEQFFESLANTIGVGYAKCEWEPTCIVSKYVWHYSENRVNNVNSIRNS